MFNEYNTEVIYEAVNGKDRFGGIKYKDKEKILVRDINSKLEINFDSKNINTVLIKNYHIPRHINIEDKIDGRVVKYVDNVRDIFGKFIYCIVGVI